MGWPDRLAPELRRLGRTRPGPREHRSRKPAEPRRAGAISRHGGALRYASPFALHFTKSVRLSAWKLRGGWPPPPAPADRPPAPPGARSALPDRGGRIGSDAEYC